MKKLPATTAHKMMLGLILVFILPVILAKSALVFQWFNNGSTNLGHLVEGELTLSALGVVDIKAPPSWLIAVRLSSKCSLSCAEKLQYIINTYKALGRDQKRAQPVLLLNEQSFTGDLSVFQPQWHIAFSQALKGSTDLTGDVFIVDPLDNIVLSYQWPADSQSWPLLGKAILNDVKKLLKYSKIG